MQQVTQVMWKSFILNTYSHDYCICEIKRIKDNWNQYVTKTLDVILKKDDTFIDIGAHIGSLSLYASKLVGNTMGAVYAFELSPDIYRDCLIPNLISNNCHNIIPYNCAIGEQQKLVSFSKPAIYGIDGSYNSFGMINTIENPDNTQTKILCIPLDSIVKKPPKLIKIDVEGMEMKVLEGAENIITTYKPYIIIELEIYIYKYNSTPEKIIEKLRDWGYELYLIPSPYPTDFLCIHKSRMKEFIQYYLQLYPNNIHNVFCPYTLVNELTNNYPEFKTEPQYKLIELIVNLKK